MEEIDLKELFSIFWEKKILIILITLIFVVIGYIYTTVLVTPTYGASTTLVLVATGTDKTTSGTSSESSITTTDVTLNSKLVSTYSELIKSNSVIRKVIDNLGITTDENLLRKRITVKSVSDTELIKITVESENPNYAEKIANEIAVVFTQTVSEIYNISNVTIVDKAEIPEEPDNVDSKKNMAIFGFIGLVLSLGYILLINMLDNTVKSPEEVEKKLKLIVLASIPIYDMESEKGAKKK